MNEIETRDEFLPMRNADEVRAVAAAQQKILLQKTKTQQDIILQQAMPQIKIWIKEIDARIMRSLHAGYLYWDIPNNEHAYDHVLEFIVTAYKSRKYSANLGYGPKGHGHRLFIDWREQPVLASPPGNQSVP